MTTITDDYMMTMLQTTKTYTIALLKSGPRRHDPELKPVIWEHGRRNFALKADGVLAIVCPIMDDSDTDGLCIFNADLEQSRAIMDGDPAVQAGIFTYELHPCRGFPGSALPA